MEKLFFNKGLISGMILLGQGDKQDFLQKKCLVFLHKHFFGRTNCLPRLLATVVNLANIAEIQNNLEKFGHNSEPSYQEGYYITCIIPSP